MGDWKDSQYSSLFSVGDWKKSQYFSLLICGRLKRFEVFFTLFCGLLKRFVVFFTLFFGRLKRFTVFFTFVCGRMNRFSALVQYSLFSVGYWTDSQNFVADLQIPSICSFFLFATEHIVSILHSYVWAFEKKILSILNFSFLRQWELSSFLVLITLF